MEASKIEGLADCIAELQSTYKAFGISRDAKRDEVNLARLVQRHGWEDVKAALLGARYESSIDSFRPREHFGLMRISKPDIFEKLRNLGLQRQAGSQVQVILRKAQETQTPERSPEEIKRLCGSILKTMSGGAAGTS